MSDYVASQNGGIRNQSNFRHILKQISQVKVEVVKFKTWSVSFTFYLRFNPRAYKGVGCHPPKVFRQFLQQHLLSSYAVICSCSFILETHFFKVWRQSVVMVYDVISSMRSSHF